MREASSLEEDSKGESVDSDIGLVVPLERANRALKFPRVNTSKAPFP